MEYITNQLNKKNIEEIMILLPKDLFKFYGNEIIEVYYGWGCDIHNDLQGKPMETGLAWLDKLVKDSISKKIVIPGDSDFYFSIVHDEIEILFCHEGDIHIKGKNIKGIKKLFRAKSLANLKWKEFPEADAKNHRLPSPKPSPS